MYVKFGIFVTPSYGFILLGTPRGRKKFEASKKKVGIRHSDLFQYTH